MNETTDAASQLAMRAVRGAREDAVGERVDPDDAVRALRLALHAARITLPDLQADGCACGRLATAPLVELGNVRPDVALRLAEVVSEGAMHAAVREANARSRGERL
ncbi:MULTISPECIES: hypothetical protein [unclassified Streptomyces]|uniref:Uncharacterized protein n=1 Tax=Streptomyces hazeniae TaxID=3075538 RepID=A0ABU2NR54_9ACTN|nr:MULTISPECIES: hypothetical protein [unclassified Streptomyces]MDT0379466.1 hypothetical protein [Streptomyces sp. DSM 42041]